MRIGCAIGAFMMFVATGYASDVQSAFGDGARGDGIARAKIERCGSEICVINT